jgi:predicted permease
VSANWFDVLRIRPLHGRFFIPADDDAATPNVVVLSEELWRRDFNADSNIIGKLLRINAQPFTVIGVVPAGRRFPVTAELWMPKHFSTSDLSDESRGARWLGYLARVKDDVSVDAASAEVLRVSEVMEKRYPEDYRERRAKLITVRDFLVGDMKKPLYIVLGAVLLVLLIACANVANLLLVRASARESEIAIRTALGAGRGRLVRQLITESVILAVVGATVGVGIAKAGMVLLLHRAPQSLIFVNKASIDATTLAVTAVIAILTGVIFGTLPALQSATPQLALALRAGGRGTQSRHGANRTKRTIVVVELALAVMLLSGAGLLLNSFARLISVDTGFQAVGVLSMKISLPAASYDSTAVRNFLQVVTPRLRAIPGVQTVGVADAVPLDRTGNDFTFTIRGRTYARPSDQPGANIRVVNADFFTSLGIPLLRGRALQESDAPNAPHIYVVNAAFEKAYFAHESAVGQSIRVGWGEDPPGAYNQIVGVVGDVHDMDLGANPEPTIYATFAQYPRHNATLLLRTAATPASVAAPARAIIQRFDHELPVYSVQPMEDRVADSVGPQRFYATLITIFASVALVLAAVGLYGVIAYAVSQRTHELGVRVALGATSDRISRMVVREGLALTAVGLGVGIVGSIAAGELLSTLLFGVSARDPITLLSVVAVLGLVATLASWLPARRAARVDPLVAMRGD